MIKKILFLFVFIHLTFSLIAQTDTSVNMRNSSQVIISGVIHLDNLEELAWWDTSLSCVIDINGEEREIEVIILTITERNNITSLLSLYESGTLNAVFDTNSYYIPTFYSSFQYYHILPSASEEYLPKLLRTYPKERLYPGATGEIFGDVIERGDNYRIRSILHKTFLLALVEIAIINHYSTVTISPPSVIYCNDEAETEAGKYIKVLIPLLDDDDKGVW
jgi:hypothetical protein